MNDTRVEIVSENTSEIRVYIVQYWSARRRRRVREYADAVPEVDLATMSQADQDKVRHYAAVNLGKAQASHCAAGACASCKTGCYFRSE